MRCRHPRLPADVLGAMPARSFLRFHVFSGIAEYLHACPWEWRSRRAGSARGSKVAMDAEAQDVFHKSAAHRSSALVTTAVLPRRTRVLRPPDHVPAAGLPLADAVATTRAARSRAAATLGPADRSWPGCAPSHPKLAAFSPHEAQQARRADYSETGGRRDPTGFVHGRPSPRSGSSPATCCSKRQELRAKPDGADAHHQMPAGAG